MASGGAGAGVGALFYLVCFGSIVGYSAYAYALDRLPVAILSIYPYINAVVAVALGWLFYREPFGLREATAMAVIFAGVAVVKRYGRVHILVRGDLHQRRRLAAVALHVQVAKEPPGATQGPHGTTENQ